MQGLLETPGLTVAGHLVHGQVKEAPWIRILAISLKLYRYFRKKLNI
jgi:hypothetical protein